jgi:hypothetical protein
MRARIDTHNGRMKMGKKTSLLILGLSITTTAFGQTGDPAMNPAGSDWLSEAVVALEAELVAEFGGEQQVRVARGLRQVANFWRAEDGDRAVFEEFVRRNFAGDPATLNVVFDRFERLLEQLDGHMLEILLELRRQTDLDLGPILPIDETFAAYDPSAHLNDDFFANKLAFAVLLNFSLTTLEERLTDGENIWMHHLLNDSGERLFPPKLRLLSHWNLRDEIKASYSNLESALPKQRMIQKVMERIVTQTIPGVVVDSPHVDWNPYTNEVAPAAVQDTEETAPEGMEVGSHPEPDTRYAVLLECFRASRLVDPYSPTAPTLIARRFNENREIPEERVEEMFETVLSSPLLGSVAELIEARLDRPLEPFDIWYNGFRPRGAYRESELDAIVRKRYPAADAYEQDMPNLLVQLGFSEARAKELAANIVVESARGSGHAWGAGMREAKSRLRTRVGAEGMDYKGFNIAVHEMGHNVEQTISLNSIDHTLLEGVPNTAFTEALAFVFQSRDLELLGLASPDAEARALRTLDDFWGAAEISAVALVDMGVWHWMYENPEATPAELKEATIRISREIWNRYYAPIFGEKDVVLLGIYSHMIHSFLYLPDYPIGHMIAHQIEEQIDKSGELGEEFERMARFGNLAPDLWMRKATGSPVGPEALLAATERALTRVSHQ